MRCRLWLKWYTRYSTGLILSCSTASIGHASTPVAPACRTVIVVGEVNAGTRFVQEIGNDLEVVLQPISSGWILRVLPTSTSWSQIGQPGQHDLAELATPPYQSVTPLSISTDFAFRAQDAIGWNPRRFRFAASTADFARLERLFEAYERTPSSVTAQTALTEEIGRASEAVFTILDATLIPGAADQQRTAASVSANFQQTAHTLIEAPGSKATLSGAIVWFRFQVALEVPRSFRADSRREVVPHVCGAR